METLMTLTEFQSECLNRCIDSSIALENDNLIEAIKAKDNELLLKILDSEF